jgi:ribosomal-protein-alanine N-acetyltransferase
MIIKGDRVSLRPVSPADVDELYSLVSAVEERGHHYPITFKAEPLYKKAYQETGFWGEKRGTLLIVDKKDKIAGDISFFQSSTYNASFEIGFVIFNPADRGKGYMTQAVNLFIPYLFAIKEVHRFEAVAMEGNIASQRVLEKCGFSYEGTLRQALFYRGDYVNLRLYSILRTEAGPLLLG